MRKKKQHVENVYYVPIKYNRIYYLHHNIKKKIDFLNKSIKKRKKYFLTKNNNK